MKMSTEPSSSQFLFSPQAGEIYTLWLHVSTLCIFVDLFWGIWCRYRFVRFHECTWDFSVIIRLLFHFTMQNKEWNMLCHCHWDLCNKASKLGFLNRSSRFVIPYSSISSRYTPTFIKKNPIKQFTFICFLFSNMITGLFVSASDFWGHHLPQISCNLYCSVYCSSSEEASTYTFWTECLSCYTLFPAEYSQQHLLQGKSLVNY